MENSRQILESLVETINGQLNETYMLGCKDTGLYNMYKENSGTVDCYALCAGEYLNWESMFWYLTNIVLTNRAYKVGYNLHAWYNVDYYGLLIPAELIEICSDSYRFRDNNQQTYTIPFGSLDLINNHITNF